MERREREKAGKQQKSITFFWGKGANKKATKRKPEQEDEIPHTPKRTKKLSPTIFETPERPTNIPCVATIPETPTDAQNRPHAETTVATRPIEERYRKIVFWGKRLKRKRDNEMIGIIYVYFSFSTDVSKPDYVTQKDKQLFPQGLYQVEGRSENQKKNSSKVYNTLTDCLDKLMRQNHNTQRESIADDSIYFVDFRKTQNPQKLRFTEFMLSPDEDTKKYFEGLKYSDEVNFIFSLMEKSDILVQIVDEEGNTVAHYAAKKGFLGVLQYLEKTAKELLDKPSILYNETPLHWLMWEFSRGDSDPEPFEKCIRFLLDQGCSTTTRSTGVNCFADKDGGTPLHYLCSQPRPDRLPETLELSYCFREVAVGGIYLRLSEKSPEDNQSETLLIVNEIYLAPDKFSINEVDREKLRDYKSLQDDEGKAISPVSPFLPFFKSNDTKLREDLEVRHRLSVSSMLSNIQSDKAWISLCTAWINQARGGRSFLLENKDTDQAVDPRSLLGVMRYIKEQIMAKINGPQNVFIGPADCNQALGRLIKWFNEPKRMQEKLPWYYPGKHKKMSDNDYKAFTSMERFNQLSDENFDRKNQRFIITLEKASFFYSELAHHDRSEDGLQEKQVPNFWINFSR